MSTYQRKTSSIEGFELMKEFATTAEKGYIADQGAARAFIEMAIGVVAIVDQIDGRRKLSRADLACAVAKLARSTPEAWPAALKDVGIQARKLEKQLGAVIAKQDPFYYEASLEP